MTCNISLNSVRKWEIDYNFINKLYVDHLYLTREESGYFEMCTENKNARYVIKTNEGSADTVSAPRAIVNYHSHPASCYIAEKTYYGWPSGEDLRETVVFGLTGSACHIIPSVEGTYKMQPNPCVLIDMINLQESEDLKKFKVKTSDLLRGVIIFCIENYFKITHGYRLISYFNKSSHKISNVLKKSYNKPILSPNDFIEFVNNVEFNHFDKELVDYLYDYCKNDDIDLLSENGVRGGSIPFKKIGKKPFLKILQSLKNLGGDCNLPELYYDNPLDNWKSKTRKIFKLELYENAANGSNYIDLNNKDKLIVLNNRTEIKLQFNKNIEFYMFDMVGSCDHKSISNHIKNISKQIKKTTGLVEIFGSNQCSFCVKAEERITGLGKRVLIFNVGEDDINLLNDTDYDYIMFKYPSIKEAIDNAKIYAKDEKHKVNGIPSFFVNGKIDENYKLD